MDLFGILNLIAGLALFLYGMNSMGEGLEKFSGGKLEKALEKMTSSTFKGFLLGTAVTAVIQSSSATTVMVVGFINSGIMKLRQGVGVIIGANLGTVITSWILSLSGIEGDNIILRLLKPTSFSAILALIGIIFHMFCKSNSKKTLGTIFLSFAVLMFGMKMMSDAVAPLAYDPNFTGFLTLFNNPIFGIFAGVVLTAIIQSSSASIGILQAISSTGTISFSMAVPIILGQNIGTCVTALISCIGAKKNAKRAAFVHLYYNILGVILFCLVFYTVMPMIEAAFIDEWTVTMEQYGTVNPFVDVVFMGKSVNQAVIAIIHTVFNLFEIAVLLPLNRVLEKLACLTVRDKDEVTELPFLDERFLSTPAVATERAFALSEKMARLSEGTILGAIELIGNFDDKTAQTIAENEDLIDAYEDVISTYLVKLSTKELSEADSKKIHLMLHAVGDFERVSDHAVNILSAAKEIKEKNIVFSEEAQAGLDVMIEAVREILNNTTLAFVHNDIDMAIQIEPLEQVIDRLRDKLKDAHVRRLTNGECTIELGFVFSDLITNIERISDHCSNIAIGIIETNNNGYDVHEYLHELKNSDDLQFNEDYQKYKKKYALPKIAK